MNSRNTIGAANVLVQQGDSILSPSFTSPLALNLIPAVRQLGWTYELWDAKEAEFRLIPNAQATACYEEASALFKEAQSLRGQAAIFLRYACLELSVVLTDDASGGSGSEARTTRLDLARQHLTASRKMFGEDSTHALIANGHEIILAIFETDYPKALDLAFDVGLVAKVLQNTSVAEFVGVLLLRLGRSLSLCNSWRKSATIGTRASMWCTKMPGSVNCSTSPRRQPSTSRTNTTSSRGPPTPR